MQSTICSTAKPAIGYVCEQAGETSLKILKAVDETVDSLVADQRELNGLMAVALNLIETVNHCERQTMIDPEGDGADSGEKAEAALREAVVQLENKRAAAVADPELNGDHENAVVDEYTRTIEAAKNLHDALATLRWAVMEHDADLDSSEEATTDAEDLIARLRA